MLVIIVSKDEDLRQFLISKDIKKDLIRPYPCFLSKKGKPRIFESSLKLFIIQFIFDVVCYYFFMWVILWRFQEFKISYVYMSIFSGFIMALVFVIRIMVNKKRLGIINSKRFSLQKKPR
jgi:hypothetical protein